MVPAQLYMTMHLEYMYAYIAIGGFNFNTFLQNPIIGNWHFDQASQWRSLGPLPFGLHTNYLNPLKAFSIPMNNHYSLFGFQIINQIP